MRRSASGQKLGRDIPQPSCAGHRRKERDLQLPEVSAAPVLHSCPQELTRKRERPPGVQASALLLLGGGPDGRNLPKRHFFQQFSAAAFRLSLEWQSEHKMHLY